MRSRSGSARWCAPHPSCDPSPRARPRARPLPRGAPRSKARGAGRAAHARGRRTRRVVFRPEERDLGCKLLHHRREGGRVHVDAGRDGTKREGRGQMRGRQNEDARHHVDRSVLSTIQESSNCFRNRRYADEAGHGTSLQLCNKLPRVRCNPFGHCSTKPGGEYPLGPRVSTIRVIYYPHAIA